MPSFGTNSVKQLATCHPDLITLFNEVIKYFDCSVIEGFRNEEDQNKDFEEGRTKLQWPHGNHNKNPSCAVDVYLYPINMKNTVAFYYFAGAVKAIAKMLLSQGKISHEIRWGGDWADKGDFASNKFNDLVHFELKL